MLMSTFRKLRQLYVKSAMVSTSIKHLQYDKPVDFLQEQVSPHISQFLSSNVPHADTLTPSSNQKKENHWINYSGLQDEIYE